MPNKKAIAASARLNPLTPSQREGALNAAKNMAFMCPKGERNTKYVFKCFLFFLREVGLNEASNYLDRGAGLNEGLLLNDPDFYLVFI